MEQFNQIVLIISVLIGLVAIPIALRVARTSRSRRGWLLVTAGVALAILVQLMGVAARLSPGLGALLDHNVVVWCASFLALGLAVLGMLNITGFVGLGGAEEALKQQRQREMEALNAAAIALQRATTEEEIFQAVGSEWAGLGAWTCFLWFGDDQLHGVVRYLSSPQPGGLERLQGQSGLKPTGLAFPVARLPAEFREVQAGRATYLSHLDQVPSMENPLLALLAYTGGTRALLAPLRIGSGQVVGALVVLSDQLTRGDLPGVVLLARQVSAALDTVHVRSEARLRSVVTLQRLAQTSQQVTSGLHANQVLQMVCRTLVENLGYRMAWVVTKEEATSDMALAAHAGCGQAGPPLTLIRLADDDTVTGPTGAAIWTQRSSVWHDRRDLTPSSAWQLALREMGCYSLIAVPLGSSGDTWGALNVASVEPHAFGEDVVPILEMLANQAAAAVEHSRSYTALMEERRRLSMLHEVAREVNSSLDVAEILSRAVERVAIALDAKTAYLFLLDPDSRRMRLRAVSGARLPAEALDRHLNLRVGEGLAGWVAEYGQAVVVPDATMDSRWLYVDEMDRDVRAAVCVPLVTEGRTVGTLSATHTTPGHFQEEHLHLLDAIVQQVAVAVENAELYRRVGAQAEAQARLSGQLRNLQAITRAMTSTLDPQEVLDVVAEGAVTQLGYQMAWVSMYLPDRGVFRLAAVYPRGPIWYRVIKIVGTDLMALCFPLDLREKPGQALLLEGKPRGSSSLADFVSPVIPAEKADNIQQLFRSRAYCAVPMRSKGHLVGSILVGTDQSEFAEEEIEALRLTAAQAAVAMENAQLYEREQTGRRVADTLLAASATLSSTLELQRVLDLVLQQLELVIPYDTALILLRDVEGPLLRAVAARGKVGEEIRDFRLQVEDNPIYQEMEETREPVLISDVTADPRWKETPGISDAHAWVGAPLIARGEIIGQLAVFHPAAGFYSSEHSALLLGFANQAAAAIENARLYDQLRVQMEELNRTQTRLIQAEKMSAIGQLVSGVAHELNNPLTSVLGYAQMLIRRDETDDSERQDLERIATQANRAARIVRNLLDFAREQPPAKRWISINELLNRTIVLRAYELQVSNVTVVKDYERGLPNTMADPQQMQQVFLNIILNAEQALVESQGGGQLMVRTRCRELPQSTEGSRPARVLRIEFSDDGPGISPEILPRVFDPFFTTKGVGKGTGLGLSIAYGYVAEHEGQIWVENNPAPETGCTFFVELPVVGSAPSEESPLEDESPVAFSGSARILIVEDEETVAELYGRALSVLGHEIRVASDGRRALEWLRTEPADLVISDVKMAGMDGIVFYEELKQFHPALAEQTIFITGDTVSMGTRRFLERSGRPHLSKPVDLDELEELVSRVLQRTGSQPGQDLPSDSGS